MREIRKSKKAEDNVPYILYRLTNTLITRCYWSSTQFIFSVDNLVNTHWKAVQAMKLLYSLMKFKNDTEDSLDAVKPNTIGYPMYTFQL